MVDSAFRRVYAKKTPPFMRREGMMFQKRYCISIHFKTFPLFLFFSSKGEIIMARNPEGTFRTD